jgi:hypothetical protein
MSDLLARLELDRVLNAIDARRAIVILVDDNDQAETADKNLGEENVLRVLFHLAYLMAQDIRARQPAPELPSSKPAIVLPPEVERKLRLL